MRGGWRAVLIALGVGAPGCSARDVPVHVESPSARVCEAGEIASGVACVAAGVPSEACASGYRHDGVGCETTAPEVCPPGEMALAGENCHPIFPCPAGAWDGIPVDDRTVFVDPHAAPGGSELGTREHPFRSVQTAVDTAPEGAIVALAPGEYPGPVVVRGKVQLWGRCPTDVTLVSSVESGGHAVRGVVDAAIELHRLGVRGGSGGVLLAGGRELTIDSCWFRGHETYALHVADLPIPWRVAVTLRNSLFEAGKPPAASPFDTVILFAREGAFALDHVLVRGNGAREAGCVGVSTVAEGASLEIRDSRIARCGYGASSSGDGARMDLLRTWIHDCGGEAVRVSHGGKATLDEVLVEKTRGVGAYVQDAEASVSRSTIRGVEPVASEEEIADGEGGIGILLQGLERPTALELRESTIVETRVAGVAAFAAKVKIHGSLVRGVAPSVVGSAGDGIAIMRGPAGPSELEIDRTRIESVARAAISSFGSEATIASTRFQCNAIALNGEELVVSARFSDRGGNWCGCDEVSEACQAQSHALLPPEPRW